MRRSYKSGKTMRSEIDKFERERERRVLKKWYLHGNGDRKFLGMCLFKLVFIGSPVKI